MRAWLARGTYLQTPDIGVIVIVIVIVVRSSATMNGLTAPRQGTIRVQPWGGKQPR